MPRHLKRGFLLLALSVPSLAFSQCVPTGGTLQVSGDDTSSVWVNGHLVAGPVSYCGTACVPATFLIPAPDFDQGSNVLVAVQTDNVNPNLVFSTWVMEITCSGGFTWVVSSQIGPNLSLYYDPNGGPGASCSGAVPPAPDGSSNPWTAFNYSPSVNPFNLTGAAVTTSPTYAAPIYDPISGSPITPISFDAAASSPISCGSLYWRQSFVIPTPTVTPTLTFTRTFTPTPTLTPSFTPTLSPTRTLTFTPTLSPTFTLSPTWTLTRTWTFTPTLTFTPTQSFTATLSFTPTQTPTSTFSRTPTWTPTQTFTPTVTRTFTQTYTPTATFTLTSTPTPCGFPGNTCTPTATPQNLFLVSKNLFDPKQGPVSIAVACPSYPGEYDLLIYNSAGEHIKTLDSQQLIGPYQATYLWYGKNKYEEDCASGVYLIYLREPFGVQLKRLLLVR